MRRALLISTGVLWLSAAPALGQDDGVHIDPDSPTAKEYAIPLDSARRQAGGGGPSAPGAEETTTPAPRFGEGVGDETGDAGASEGGAGGSGKGSSGSGSGGSSGGPSAGSGSGGSGATATATGVASRPGAPDGGGIGTPLMVVGGAAALLLVGAGAGYALRRRDLISPS